MRKLLLIALLLANAPAYSATTEQITNALSKYCVPKPNDYVDGTKVCGTEFEGYFQSGSACGCHADDTKYMQYDPSLRRCKVVCPKGTRAVVKPSCPKGYKAYAINRKN